MRHSAELYLDQALIGGLADLQLWDGDAVSIFPLIRWDGLYNVSLARLSLLDSPADFGAGFMEKLSRLNELSRAYGALRLWQSGLSNPECLTHENDCGVPQHDLVRSLLSETYRLGNSREHGTHLGLLHYDDMVAVDSYFIGLTAIEAAAA